MISYLQGNMILRGKDFVILDVQGVGYKVFVAEKTLSTLPKTGEGLKLYTHFSLREETAELYGFLALAELELFETLNNISGIGPRTALALSSFGSIEKLKEALEAQGTGAMAKMKGLGKKKLQKITLELTGKIKEIREESARDQEKEDEALDALIALGIPRQRAKTVLEQLPNEIRDTQQRIREALRQLKR